MKTESIKYDIELRTDEYPGKWLPVALSLRLSELEEHVRRHRAYYNKPGDKHRVTQVTTITDVVKEGPIEYGAWMPVSLIPSVITISKLRNLLRKK